ncbi:MAG: cholesterol esterase [Thelocarpon superellum]|nr:MAG: cholesterol esterase [Thelocarpon superellum]
MAGQLLLGEYLALIGSLILIGLEAFIRVITLALPDPVIRFFYNRSRIIFNFYSPQPHKKKTIVDQIRDASDFVDMCALFGYHAEEHIVQTGDGYFLGLHRLGWRKGEESVRVNAGHGSVKKPVVYLHHGILMNSEVWVCITDQERCLPFQLVERGYDVWLGNNRGNKYSKKSTIHSPTSTEFWNFSIDEFAFHDIPDSISYILSTTAQPSLSYVGFSQGTAQAFASLSVHPTLNDKVDVFIALAPAMSPAGLSNGVVDALMKASPDVIFLAFGRRTILGSTTMWQALLYPPLFVRIIDLSLSFLFNWHGRNISPHQKLAAYAHLYSFTSTKSVVHWFQIIRTKSFQMYDDDTTSMLNLGGGGKYSKKHRYPTRNIKTPTVLVYGGSDSLVDITVMLKELPQHTIAKEIPHYEHLDFLWGNELDQLVFPHVFSALDTYAAKDHALARHQSPSPLTKPSHPAVSRSRVGNEKLAPNGLASTNVGNAPTEPDDFNSIRSKPSSATTAPSENSWLSEGSLKSPKSEKAAREQDSPSHNTSTGKKSQSRSRKLSSKRSIESLTGGFTGASTGAGGIFPGANGITNKSKPGVGVGVEGITLGASKAVTGLESGA